MELLQGGYSRFPGLVCGRLLLPGALTAIGTKDATTERETEKLTRMFVHRFSPWTHAYKLGHTYDSRTVGVRGSPQHRKRCGHYGQRGRKEAVVRVPAIVSLPWVGWSPHKN